MQHDLHEMNRTATLHAVSVTTQGVTPGGTQVRSYSARPTARSSSSGLRGIDRTRSNSVRASSRASEAVIPEMTRFDAGQVIVAGMCSSSAPSDARGYAVFSLHKHLALLIMRHVSSGVTNSCNHKRVCVACCLNMVYVLTQESRKRGQQRHLWS